MIFSTQNQFNNFLLFIFFGFIAGIIFNFLKVIFLKNNIKFIFENLNNKKLKQTENIFTKNKKIKSKNKSKKFKIKSKNNLNFLKKFYDFSFDLIIFGFFSCFFAFLINFFNFGKLTISLTIAYSCGIVWLNSVIKNLVAKLENKWYTTLNKISSSVSQRKENRIAKHKTH